MDERWPSNGVSSELPARTGLEEKITDGHHAYLGREELKTGTSKSSLPTPKPTEVLPATSLSQAPSLV